jgi:predicted  nucleic acid-binding Zn-ribbon protein
MKNQELRSSLIKSGVILILCVFFIYSFASGESGGVSGTLGSLVSAVVFIVGLSLALVVSVAILFALYFGILYLYNPETCGPTFDEMKGNFSEVCQSMSCGCCSHTTQAGTCNTNTSDDCHKPEAHKEALLAAQLTEVQRELSSLQGTGATITADLDDTVSEVAKMNARLEAIEEDLSTRPTQDSVVESSEQVSTDLSKLKESLSPIQGSISSLEASINDLNSKIEAAGANNPQEQIDSAVNAIKEELKTMQQALATLTEQATATVQTNPVEPKDEGHRILSYFTNKGDAEAFATKVATAVEQEMTYAEIGEFLDDSLSAEASEVIADHPSLTKDFIRTCRQNG